MSVAREGLRERSTGPVSAWVASSLLVVDGGAVEVRTLGASEWRPAAPLMSLLAGDTVRANDGASAVILLRGGRGSLRSAVPDALPANSVNGCWKTECTGSQFIGRENAEEEPVFMLRG